MTDAPAPSRPTVTVVIPARDASGTIGDCVRAVLANRAGRAEIEAVYVVDDDSHDGTMGEALDAGATVIPAAGGGAGHARNIGWRRASSELIWFVDADCIAEPDALTRLLSRMTDPDLAAVGGTYANARRDSLLARLIHEEIALRHDRMPHRVDFLATFNVLYRRSVLEAVGGFDERFFKGQDAELAFRVLATGRALGFEPDSVVAHHHETSLMTYLRIQRMQGHWRAWLHLTHRGHGGGDSYSNRLDHAQPVLALLTVLAVPLAIVPSLRWLPVALLAAFLLAHLPLTVRIVRRGQRLEYLAFLPMSVLRSAWRAWGLVSGLASFALSRVRRSTSTAGAVVS